jgi:hypothetical protein
VILKRCYRATLIKRKSSPDLTVRLLEREKNHPNLFRVVADLIPLGIDLLGPLRHS